MPKKMQQKNAQKPNKFFNRLKFALKQNNMTQTELAQKTGFALSTISRWDTKIPQARSIDILAKAINVTPFWLAHGEIMSPNDMKDMMARNVESETSKPREESIPPRYSLNTPSGEDSSSNPLEELLKSMTTEELARALNMYGEMALKSNDNMVVKTCAAMAEIFARELRKKI